MRWHEFCKLPEGRQDAQCVIVGNSFYVGGGSAEQDKDHAKLFVSSTDLKSWSQLTTPTSRYALATYHSQLVLVGGEDSTGLITDKLWMLDAGDNWCESLPPVLTARQASVAVNTRHPEYLIVAGGEGHARYCGSTLPEKCAHMKQTLHRGKLFLMRGSAQSFSVYCCDVKTLIDSSTLPDASPKSPLAPLWSEFDHVPLCYASAATLGRSSSALGGMGTKVSPGFTLTRPTVAPVWLRVESLPVDLCAVSAVFLPGEHLVVVGGQVIAGESAHTSDIPYGSI